MSKWDVVTDTRTKYVVEDRDPGILRIVASKKMFWSIEVFTITSRGWEQAFDYRETFRTKAEVKKAVNELKRRFD